MRDIHCLIALGLLASPAIVHSEELHFGETWTGENGELMKPQIDVFWNAYYNPGLTFLRVPELDKINSKLDQGVFPLSKKEAENYVSIEIQLSFDTDGRPMACNFNQRSTYSAVKEHVCYHILKYARFHAPLDETGQRVAISRRTFTVSYSAYTGPVTPKPVPGFENKPKVRNAAPVKQPTASTLGLGNQAEAKGRVASVVVSLDDTGKPISCELSGATFVDSIDAQICAKVSKIEYVGALDHKNEPTNGVVFMDIKF